MDYFSRQLTIILNRLRTGVRSDLQKIDGSIRADTAAQHAPKDYGVDTPILVNVLRTPEAAANEKDAKEARQSREERDRKRLRIETWALFIGATVAVANVALWIQTREATRIAAISASAAQKGAAAAASQAEATKASIDATVANFRLEQRAWVGPDSMPSAVKLIPNQNALVVVIAKNTGRTPALETKTKYALDISPAGTPPKVRYVTHGYQSISTLWPGAATAMNIGTHTPVTDALVKAIKDGNVVIYAYGKILYKDVFKACHRSRFCFVIDKEGMFLCDTYNDADDDCTDD